MLRFNAPTFNLLCLFYLIKHTTVKKTVNQWIDVIQSLPIEKRKLSKVLSFQQKLAEIKKDEEYKGFGGAVSVEVDEELENILLKTNTFDK